jgi:hypothetical protein
MRRDLPTLDEVFDVEPVFGHRRLRSPQSNGRPFAPVVSDYYQKLGWHIEPVDGVSYIVWGYIGSAWVKSQERPHGFCHNGVWIELHRCIATQREIKLWRDIQMVYSEWGGKEAVPMRPDQLEAAKADDIQSRLRDAMLDTIALLFNSAGDKTSADYDEAISVAGRLQSLAEELGWAKPRKEPENDTGSE